MFGRHRISDRSSTATGVFIPVEKVTVGCVLIEAFRMHGQIMDELHFGSNIFETNEINEFYIQNK